MKLALTFALTICVITSHGKLAKSSKIETPPGTVKIAENFYFDQTEVTNFSWLEYLHWNKKEHGKNSAEYKAAIPDTSVWHVKGLTPFEENYLRHPAFQNFPVVGVSYEQAVNYCQWRSDRVNEMLFIRSNKKKKTLQNLDRENIPEVFKYRLPSEKEWEIVASASFSKKVLRKQKGQQPHNLAGKPLNDGVDEDGATLLAPSDSYWPNSYNVYNVIGNVAEMISKKGVAKGGSWTHKPEEAQVELEQHYTTPTNWLGFRCVCEPVH